MIDEGTLLHLLFDYLGFHILSAHEDDGIFDSPDDDRLAVLRPDRQIAGVEPAVVGEYLGGGFGIFIVSRHHLGTPGEDDTLFADCGYRAVFPADLDFGVVEGDARGAEGIVFDGTAQDSRGAFGHAVGVDDGDSQGVEQFIQVLRQ